MLNGTFPSSPMGFSPLRSNIEEMIASCSLLDRHIGMMNDDKECYGLLTEDSFCYDAPEVLTQLSKISRNAILCTRDVNLVDEAFDVDERSLAQILWNFIAEYRRIIDQITALGTVMKSTGSLYGAMGQTLHRQKQILDTFRSAIDARYPMVKLRAMDDWKTQSEALQLCLEAYPLPVEESIRLEE